MLSGSLLYTVLFLCLSRLLGEPCDPATLIQHYGKPGSRIHTDTEMDFKSESAAIYVLVSSGVNEVKHWRELLTHQGEILLSFILLNRDNNHFLYHTLYKIIILYYIYISFIQVVATLYLVMVAVMVGLNYRLRGRHHQVKQKDSGEVEEVEYEERRGVSVSFTEGRAPYSSLVGRLSGEGRGMDSTRVDLWMSAMLSSPSYIISFVSFMCLYYI